MKRILVTGANGQLGSEIRELSTRSSDQFIFVDIDAVDLSSEEDAGHSLKGSSPTTALTAPPILPWMKQKAMKQQP